MSDRQEGNGEASPVETGGRQAGGAAWITLTGVEVGAGGGKA